MTSLFATLLLALGTHESGNNDRAVGRAGEVSRYQIMPGVWSAHTNDRRWHEHAVSEQVARKILGERIHVFTTTTGETPTPAEVYALWNAPGLFARRGYHLSQMPRVIQDRCKRFSMTFARLERQQKQEPTR